MSSIEWTDKTWNPIVSGCSMISAGCSNCYAMKMAFRLEQMGQERYKNLTEKTASGKIRWNGKIKINLDDKALFEPLKRKKPTMYFVNSMTDLFHEDVPFEAIDKIMAVIALCPHTFQVLTKRPERMKTYFESRMSNFNQTIEDCILQIVRKDNVIFENNKNNKWASLFKEYTDEGEYKAYCVISTDVIPNLWLGVSVENQKTANERIPYLLETPAKVRFLSCEPLLSYITLQHIEKKATDTYFNCLENGIDWVIVGGESGKGARPMHPDWVQNIKEQCENADISFFFKQWGGKNKKKSGRLLNGRTYDEMPK